MEPRPFLPALACPGLLASLAPPPAVLRPRTRSPAVAVARGALTDMAAMGACRRCGWVETPKNVLHRVQKWQKRHQLLI